METNAIAKAKNELIADLRREKALCAELAEKYAAAGDAKTTVRYEAYLKKINGVAASLERQIRLLEQGQKAETFPVFRAPVGLKNIPEMLRERFEDRVGSLYKGFEIANRVCSYDNTDLYVLLYRQEGDALHLLKKLPAVKKYYGENAARYHFKDEGGAFIKKKTIRRLFIVTKPANIGVVRLFSGQVDGVIILPYAELEKLAGYSLSPCALHQNIVCEADAMRIMGNRQETDEGQWCRLKMFGGVSDIERELCIPHNIFKPCCSPRLSAETQKLAQELCERGKINPPGTAVLCPYAKYSSMLDISVWVKFAKILRAQGKAVYTYAADNDPTVAGTELLKTDIDVLACLCERGARLYGVHGSITDVVNAVTPKNLVCLSVIRNEKDREYAKARNVFKEVNRMPGGAVYLRLEHFEEEYILDLLRRIGAENG